MLIIIKTYSTLEIWFAWVTSWLYHVTFQTFSATKNTQIRLLWLPAGKEDNGEVIKETMELELISKTKRGAYLPGCCEILYSAEFD